jgi:hypothetical protein
MGCSNLIQSVEVDYPDLELLANGLALTAQNDQDKEQGRGS